MERLRGNAAIGTRLVVVLLVSLGIAGCGPDDSGTDETEPSRSEFIEQANVICEQNNVVLRKALAEAFDPEEQPDDETGIRFTREVWLPNVREQNGLLRELGMPPEDRQQ